MKKLNHTQNVIVLISIGLAVLLSGCKKAEEVEVPKDDIIGLWVGTSVTVDITYQGMSAYDYWISQGYTPDEAEWQVGHQARGFSTYTLIQLNFKENGILETLNGEIGDTDGYSHTLNWSLNENRDILTISGEGLTLDAPILELTKSNLSFKLIFDSDEYSQELMTYGIVLTYER